MYFLLHKYSTFLFQLLSFSADDYEFSLMASLPNGEDRVPPVRDQGATDTCVFQSTSAAGEIEMRTEAALSDPPRACRRKIDTKKFVQEYEDKHGKINSDICVHLLC